MKRRYRQLGGQGGPPPGGEPPPGLSPLFRPFGNYMSFGLRGGYSDVIKFAQGGAAKTPLELLQLLKLTDAHPELHFESVIRHEPELARMYRAHLRRGLSRIEAMRAVQNEVASRLVGE